MLSKPWIKHSFQHRHIFVRFFISLHNKNYSVYYVLYIISLWGFNRTLVELKYGVLSASSMIGKF